MRIDKRLDYIKALSERIEQMKEENALEKKKFQAVVHKKIFGAELNNEEYLTYFRAGVKYSKTVINAFENKLDDVLISILRSNLIRREMSL